MPDDFVPPISGAPLRTRTFLARVGEQARRSSQAQSDTGRKTQQAVRSRPCRVQKVSGNAGSDSVDCSFLYDIYELDNTTKINVSSGAITPKGPPRDPKVEYTEATYGEF